MFYQQIEQSPSRKRKTDPALLEAHGKSTKEASDLAKQILADHPNINIGYLIECLQMPLISTTHCCEVLGISYTAFFRLRKKYSIVPVYSISKNNQNQKSLKTFAPIIKHKYAKKNFYTKAQLESIPASEIQSIQLRAARSLKFPNGDKTGWKWSPRGYHSNGKLRARTDNLKKFDIKVSYIAAADKYIIEYNTFADKLLSRKEVDNFNIQINKMKHFL